MKPTTVTADAYLKHHSHKQCQITKDPLAEILNKITKNPGSYTTKKTTSNKNKSDTKQKDKKDSGQYSMEASNTIKQPVTQAIKDSRIIIEYGDTIRTRSGCISKNRTDWSTDKHQDKPSQQVSCTVNVVWPTALFCNSRHLFV